MEFIQFAAILIICLAIIVSIRNKYKLTKEVDYELSKPIEFKDRKKFYVKEDEYFDDFGRLNDNIETKELIDLILIISNGNHVQLNDLDISLREIGYYMDPLELRNFVDEMEKEGLIEKVEYSLN